MTQKDGGDLISQLRSLFKVTTPLRDQINAVTSPKTKLVEKRIYDRLDTATFESATILLEYLTRFPFFGKRQISIDSWKKLMKYRKSKFPVTAATTATIQKLVDQTKKVENQLQVNSAVGSETESSILQELEVRVEDLTEIE